MRLFISWSGTQSKAIAESLSAWLAETIQLVEPWVSSDIDKGKRWGHEVTEKLQSSPIGIICVTPENLTSPWLLFEAGAISNTKDAHVCTLLFGLKPTDVEQQLSQFQATAFEKSEFRHLLETINARLEACGERSLPAATLGTVFETNWPRLEAQVTALQLAAPKPVAVRRDPADLLEEALQILRELDRRTSDTATPPFSLRDIANIPDSIAAAATPMQRPQLHGSTDDLRRRRILATALASVGAANALMAAGAGGSVLDDFSTNALLAPLPAPPPMASPPVAAPTPTNALMQPPASGA